MTNCSSCGTQMRYVREYNRWYCTRCSDYRTPAPEYQAPPPRPYDSPRHPKSRDMIGIVIVVIAIFIIILYFASPIFQERPDDLEIHIIADGSWSGTISDESGSREVSGYGNEIIEVEGDSVSATIQKGFTTNKLTVQIRGDGRILQEGWTTISDDTVSVSY